MKRLDYTIPLMLFILFIAACSSGAFSNMEKPEIEDTFNTAIEKGHFPCYQLADSLWGIDSRGTDAWCEVALCNADEEGRMYTEHGVEFYDYSINIHMDTVWLYNGDNELVVKGDFDSLLNFIELDNL